MLLPPWFVVRTGVASYVIRVWLDTLDRFVVFLWAHFRHWGVKRSFFENFGLVMDVCEANQQINKCTKTSYLPSPVYVPAILFLPATLQGKRCATFRVQARKETRVLLLRPEMGDLSFILWGEEY